MDSPGSTPLSMDQFRQFDVGDWVEYTQRQHWRSIDLQLDRIRGVWKAMAGGRPKFVITVAGTNGKGSAVAMLDAVFQQGGKTTGAYTSPHLVRYNERIRINGTPVGDEDICAGFCAIQEARQDIPLTYFEFATLCALWIFNKYDVDIAILEVGMGGRLDAVNMIHNDIALITTVDIDHQQWLGSDRETIGKEKAGVINAGGLAVCADPDPPDSIGKAAIHMDATLLQRGADYFIDQETSAVTWHCDHAGISDPWKRLENLHSPLNGQHQIDNLAGVIATLALTASSTGITPDHLRAGIAKTSLSARCWILSDAPQIIVDVAHNRQSAKELGRFLGNTPHPGGVTRAVFGTLEDKAPEEIAAPVLDEIDFWYLVTLSGERGQTADRLRSRLLKMRKGIDSAAFQNPVEGYKKAIQDANADDRIVIFGSFYTVGDIIGFIQTEPPFSTALDHHISLADTAVSAGI